MLTTTTTATTTMQLTKVCFFCSLALGLRKRDYVTRDYYAVELLPTADPCAVASALGVDYEESLGELRHHFLFSSSRDSGLDVRVSALRRRGVGLDHAADSVKWIEKQKPKRLVKRDLESSLVNTPTVKKDLPTIDTVVQARQRMLVDVLDIRDPIFAEQWHLLNNIQVGNDVNVTGLWEAGITGHNVTVAIVDDGLDMDSNDLHDNYFNAGSFDFNDMVSEPRPRLFDDTHGTRCASEVAGVRNDVCGVGVAYDAKVAGLRILSATISDADEAKSLNYDMQENMIYSCSWGPPDDGQSMEAPGVLIQRAFVNGVQNGRDGKGSIYVFATGNGAAFQDNCNFDGYTNSIFSITVGAIDRKGLHPPYSEACSAQMVVTYSSGSGDFIHTSTVGENTCIATHGGTSAAAPLGAGIISLVLSIRPDLTWRDLQYLCRDTAVPVNLNEDGWEKTSVGKLYSHRYGYGKLDAWALVEAAKTFESVKPQAWHFSPWLHVDHDIPEGDVGLKSTYTVTQNLLDDSNVARLEHVTVTVNVNHQRRGEVSMDLISPDGLKSELCTTRSSDSSTEGFQNWTFMSVKHWGESGVGEWTLIVRDTQSGRNTGRWLNWQIKLWGESIDASRAVKLPLPGSEDEGKDKNNLPTATAPVEHVSLTSMPTSHTPTETHPSRPINSKPAEPKPADKGAPAYIPSWFPTLGVTGSSVYWVYGSIAAIVVFVASIVGYMCVRRRRQKRREAFDEYEFAALDGEDEEDTRRKPRGRDLYDAFHGDDGEDGYNAADDEEGE